MPNARATRARGLAGEHPPPAECTRHVCLIVDGVCASKPLPAITHTLRGCLGVTHIAVPRRIPGYAGSRLPRARAAVCLEATLGERAVIVVPPPRISICERSVSCSSRPTTLREIYTPQGAVYFGARPRGARADNYVSTLLALQSRGPGSIRQRQARSIDGVGGRLRE